MSDVKIHPESEIFLRDFSLSEGKTQATKFPSELAQEHSVQLEPSNILPAEFWEKSLDFEP